MFDQINPTFHDPKMERGNLIGVLFSHVLPGRMGVCFRRLVAPCPLVPQDSPSRRPLFVDSPYYRTLLLFILFSHDIFCCLSNGCKMKWRSRFFLFKRIKVSSHIIFALRISSDVFVCYRCIWQPCLEKSIPSLCNSAREELCLCAVCAAGVLQFVDDFINRTFLSIFQITHIWDINVIVFLFIL